MDTTQRQFNRIFAYEQYVKEKLKGYIKLGMAFHVRLSKCFNSQVALPMKIAKIPFKNKKSK